MSCVIGILGGMGPRATIEFEQRLIERLEGNDQALPVIVTINDGTIPDRSSYLTGNGTDPFPQLLQRALQLQSVGAEIIAMPCNSASATQILSRLQAFISIPILNLPKLTAMKIADTDAQQLLLLATEGMVRSHTYQDILTGYGVEVKVPSRSQQIDVDRLIARIKSKAFIDDDTRKLRECLVQAGCDGVILGCTELPLVKKGLLPSGIISFDTLDILAESIVAYTRDKEKLNVTR